jgi:hypothetical protein
VRGARVRALLVPSPGGRRGLVRAGREASTGSEVQLGDAIGREIDKIREQLEPLLRRELTGR